MYPFQIVGSFNLRQRRIFLPEIDQEFDTNTGSSNIPEKRFNRENYPFSQE